MEETMDFAKGRQIWVSPYVLRSAGPVNALTTRRDFYGALIKIGNGYGCIHPWPELGDPGLEKCLDDLERNRFWPIVRRAVRCAQYDDAARNAEDSLFEEMEVPTSHGTVIDPSEKNIAAAVAAGFEVVKLKAGRDLLAEASQLAKLAEAFHKLRWRIDFNEQGDEAGLGKFLESLGSDLHRKIDFLEDPCVHDEVSWARLHKKFRVPLAVDMEAGPNCKAGQVMVVKPAVDEPFSLGEGALRNGQRLIVTSYMEHPLGQAFAAWESARLELLFPGMVGICGLQTHHLFEKTAFSEKLGKWGPKFSIPGGTGLGFDEELHAQPWRRLGQ